MTRIEGDGGLLNKTQNNERVCRLLISPKQETKLVRVVVQQQQGIILVACTPKMSGSPNPDEPPDRKDRQPDGSYP